MQAVLLPRPADTSAVHGGLPTHVLFCGVLLGATLSPGHAPLVGAAAAAADDAVLRDCIVVLSGDRITRVGPANASLEAARKEFHIGTGAASAEQMERTRVCKTALSLIEEIMR
jgi:hypothetical protein